MYLLWVVKYIIIVQSNTKCRPPSHNTPAIIILPLVFLFIQESFQFICPIIIITILTAYSYGTHPLYLVGWW